MKKVASLLAALALLVGVAAYSHAAKPLATATGTITSTEMQGNNYLLLTMTTKTPGESMQVWCSAERTTVVSGGKAAGWDALSKGRTVSIAGEWIEQEGEELLWAQTISVD